MRVQMEINGIMTESNTDATTLLSDFIREEAGLTGTHVGCDTSNCGACTVLLDGRVVKSCTVLAVQAAGRKVTTIEGLGDANDLSPVQYAFWKKHGLQCGFCTPGMIVSAYALLQRNPDPDEEEIRNALAGNLCRCTGYVKIVESVRYAAKLTREGKTPFRAAARRRKEGEIHGPPGESL